MPAPQSFLGEVSWLHMGSHALPQTKATLRWNTLTSLGQWPLRPRMSWRHVWGKSEQIHCHVHPDQTLCVDLALTSSRLTDLTITSTPENLPIAVRKRVPNKTLLSSQAWGSGQRIEEEGSFIHGSHHTGSTVISHPPLCLLHWTCCYWAASLVPTIPCVLLILGWEEPCLGSRAA